MPNAVSSFGFIVVPLHRSMLSYSVTKLAPPSETLDALLPETRSSKCRGCISRSRNQGQKCVMRMCFNCPPGVRQTNTCYGDQ